MTRVAIIIVNYRTAALVAGCVRSLARDEFVRGQGRVVIVDNASGDDSLSTLQSLAGEYGSWIEVIANSENRGFAAGNNAALVPIMKSGELPEYLWLLNPDTVVEPGALEALVQLMEAQPRAGIAGSQLLDAQGTAQCSAHRFPSPLGEFEGMFRLGLVSRILAPWRVSPPLSKHEQQCDWVSGASLLARRKMVDEIGLMDEGFFLYFEEVEWCLRARRRGWQVWHAPESHVHHLEGAATGLNSSQRRAAYWYASRRRYFQEAWGLGGWIAADVCWLAGWAGHQCKRLLGRDRGRDPKWFAWDLLVGDLRAMGGRS